MNFSALLVDDDPRGVGCLHTSCARDGRADIVGTASREAEALEMATAQLPDAVFIDIDLPGLDATSLTGALRALHQPPVIVFTTARSHLAIIAFDLGVTDCVLKPTNAGRVTQAIDRVEDAVRQHRDQRAARGTDDLWLPRLGTMVRVPVSSIERIEAERDYARVWTPGGSFLLRTTMASIERRLASDDFVRIHRSTIVALDHIRGCRHVGGGAWAVIDTKGGRHSVGRRHLASVRQRLGLDATEGRAHGDQALEWQHPDDDGEPADHRYGRHAGRLPESVG